VGALTKDEIDELKDEQDVAVIMCVKNKKMHTAIKGTATELVALLGILLVDIHEQSGAPLTKLGECLNGVVEKEMKARNKYDNGADN
jgi:hypothetical protein